jgi:hypothetical protein
MRSAPENDVLKSCWGSTVENGSLITSEKAKAKTVSNANTSVSQKAFSCGPENIRTQSHNKSNFNDGDLHRYANY